MRLPLIIVDICAQIHQHGMMKIQENDQILVDDICAKYGFEAHLLIEILHDLQDSVGFIPEHLLIPLAKSLNITRAEIHGVVSFYEDFKTQKPSKTQIKICRGEACQSVGANLLFATGKELARGKDVDIEPVYCLGNCALAPAVEIDGTLVGRATKMTLASKILASKILTCKIEGQSE